MSKESFEAAIDVICGKPTKTLAKRDCELCGDPKAVGKYYVEDMGDNGHGWWRVCSDCADMVSRVGADVQYYKYSKEYQNQMTPKPSLPEDVQKCSHKWVKWSLVGEIDRRRDRIFDWMRCEKCNCFGKRFIMGQTIMDDLSMKIDLSCSR